MEASFERFVYSVGVNRLQNIFYVSESCVFEIVFPQFRRTGELAGSLTLVKCWIAFLFRVV